MQNQWKLISNFCKDKENLEREVKVHPEFAKKDVVQLMGLGIGEDEKVVADVIVINVAGGSLYGVPICKEQLSVTVVNSYSHE